MVTELIMHSTMLSFSNKDPCFLYHWNGEGLFEVDG